MAAALVPFHQPLNPPFMWTVPAAIQLIRERRNLASLFAPRVGNRSHSAAWTQVSNNLFIATGFVTTATQCRIKWNSLKRGFENLQRIMTGNQEGFPLASPDNFDHACFSEMSDQFWSRTSYFRRSYQHQNSANDRRRYEYRYRSRSPRREQSSSQDQSRSGNRRDGRRRRRHRH